MDPKACLEECERAIDAGDDDLARTLLLDYGDWRRSGGFEPTWDDGEFMRGDFLARALESELL